MTTRPTHWPRPCETIAIVGVAAEIGADKASGKETAQTLAKDVLPLWDSALESLKALPPLEGQLQAPQKKLLQYATLKGEGWHLLEKALREDDPKAFKSAKDKIEEANRLNHR